jgi:predicted small lipoprotein YifL
MKSFVYFLLIATFFATITSCQENGIFFPKAENNGTFEVIIDGTLFFY